MWMKITALILLAPIVAALGSSPEAGAFPGALDRSFGDDGRVTTNLTRVGDEAWGVAIQHDGRIVAVGGVRASQKFGLTRYRRNGTLDPSFGGDGKVSTDFTRFDADEAQDVALQADGSPVVLGSSGFFGGSNAVLSLARYLPDGSLDPAFGDGGKVTIDFDPDPDITEFAAGVAIDADGMIVAGASINATRFGAARFDADGNPDTSFDGDGMVTTKIASGREEAWDVAFQADGRIVVVGDIRLQRFALVRYTDEGALDPTFGGDGTITTNFGLGGAGASAITIQGNGMLVVAGNAKGKFALARYTEEGTLDQSFGRRGKVTTNFTDRADVAMDVAIDPDGKIIAGGGRFFGSAFLVARYRRNGSLDPSFGDRGRVMTEFGPIAAVAPAVAVQEDGRIVAAGLTFVQRADGQYAKFALARYRG